MITDHISGYDGLPVHAFDPEADGPLPEPDAVAWAIRDRHTPDGVLLSETLDNLDAFLDAVDPARVTHLVLGWWGFQDWDAVLTPVEHLLEETARLPGLRALYFGEILDHEHHISWIEQFDVTPLLEAFPLERLDVRGGDGLRIGPLRHERLRTLRIESAGLSVETVEGIVASDLPALEHLHLWLGITEGHLPALAPVLEGARFPALRHLGLCNSPEADAFAGALASAPVVAGLASLDLSMGTLTDAGVQALLAGQPLTHLTRLDLSRSYLSEATAERVRAALPVADLTRAVGTPTWTDTESEWDRAPYYIQVVE